MASRSRRVLAVSTAVVALLAVLLARAVQPDLPEEELRGRYATPTTTYLTVGDLHVRVRDEGTGPPVVLLHGTSSSLETWDGWAAVLSRTHRVVRFDLPPFGLTGPRADRDYSIDAYERLVAAVVDRLVPEHFVLSGNSLGGRIAWHYALHHGDRLRGLVLVDAAGYPTSESGRPLAFRLAKLPVLPELFARLDPKRLVAEGLAKAYGDPSRIRPEVAPRLRDFALHAGARNAFIDRMRSDVPDDISLVKRVTTETLVVWGEKDHLIDPANAARFGADLPHVKVVRYGDLGHVPMEEDPDRTVRDAAAFIDTLPP